jgi:hypothetical protein
MIDIRRFASMGENPLDKLETSYRPDMAGEIDSLGHEWAEALRLNREQCAKLILLMRKHTEFESAELAARMMIPVLTWLNEPRGNKTLRYYAFLLAAGETSLTLSGSYSELARKIGVTRAALSKAVMQVQSYFQFKGLNDFQKSEGARESSRLAAHRSWDKRHKENTPNK